MNDQEIEQEIQAKGLTAPRVTPADIEASIASEHYFTAGQGVGEVRSEDYPTAMETCQALDSLTFCVLVLRNGFTVTGESACASPENFDAGIGRKIARQNAVQKIWPLMGYALRDRMERADRGDENQYADEQNKMRLEMTVLLVRLLGLPYSATCVDVVSAVHDLLPKAPTSDRPPHQQRVIAEKLELDEKLTKLRNFFNADLFAGLVRDEQDRLARQHRAMTEYSNLLGERIAAFDER